MSSPTGIHKLQHICAPTLILAGRHDFMCAPEFSVEMHALIRNSTLKVFENSSHFLTADEPQNYIDAIVGFLVHNPRPTSCSTKETGESLIS